jgi:malate dehydrogenase (oxaloacetate-decarboxylating)
MWPATRARRINQPMIAAAADAVARLSDATAPGALLLPPVEDLRTVSAAVAMAVAVAAAKEGLRPVRDCARKGWPLTGQRWLAV